MEHLISIYWLWMKTNKLLAWSVWNRKHQPTDQKAQFHRKIYNAPVDPTRWWIQTVKRSRHPRRPNYSYFFRTNDGKKWPRGYSGRQKRTQWTNMTFFYDSRRIQCSNCLEYVKAPMVNNDVGTKHLMRRITASIFQIIRNTCVYFRRLDWK